MFPFGPSSALNEFVIRTLSFFHAEYSMHCLELKQGLPALVMQSMTWAVLVSYFAGDTIQWLA